MRITLSLSLSSGITVPHLFLSLRYFLQPRDNGGKSVKADELGSLRLNIVYTEDHVFPSESYSDLTDLLLQSVQMEVGHLVGVHFCTRRTGVNYLDSTFE